MATSSCPQQNRHDGPLPLSSSTTLVDTGALTINSRLRHRKAQQRQHVVLFLCFFFCRCTDLSLFVKGTHLYFLTECVCVCWYVHACATSGTRPCARCITLIFPFHVCIPLSDSLSRLNTLPACLCVPVCVCVSVVFLPAIACLSLCYLSFSHLYPLSRWSSYSLTFSYPPLTSPRIPFFYLAILFLFPPRHPQHCCTQVCRVFPSLFLSLREKKQKNETPAVLVFLVFSLRYRIICRCR